MSTYLTTIFLLQAVCSSTFSFFDFLMLNFQVREFLTHVFVFEILSVFSMLISILNAFYLFNTTDSFKTLDK